MSNKKYATITAAELAAQLQVDPEFVIQQEERKKQLAERAARIYAEENFLRADLRAEGVNIESVWDLVNTSTKYTGAIPLLLKHLLMPYSDSLREGIARALAVPEPEVRKAWPILVEEYRKAPTGLGIKNPGDTVELRLGAKDGLACALAATVSDSTLEEFLSLVENPIYGSSRLILLRPLKKLKNKDLRVKRVLQSLVNDMDLKKEISSWKLA